MKKILLMMIYFLYIDASHDQKNILIIGNGAREHALAWKVAQSPYAKKIYVAPGNGGTALEENMENISIAATNIPAIIQFAEQKQIDLIIVGPETPLALGIVDSCNTHNILCFGPTRTAAQLESSKLFAKKFCRKHNIPTADYREFHSYQQAITYIKSINTFPTVIKADGLAQGKGVVIAANTGEAIEAITDMMIKKKFGDAGKTIIIEEFLTGREISFIVLTDGKTIIPLEPAQDYKKRDDYDHGPNTGGMGSYCPVPITSTLYYRIMQEIIEPTVRGMKHEGNSYSGFLYAGLMIDEAGNPKLLEFNCRLGDPEAQVILMRLKTDIVELCYKTVTQQLDTIALEWSPLPALCVVLASTGYPENYKTGDEIHGLDSIRQSNDLKIFHAGTVLEHNNIKANGGRVLSVAARDHSFNALRNNIYSVINQISWDSKYCRSDIGMINEQ